MVRTGNAVTARSLSRWRDRGCGGGLDAWQSMLIAWRVRYLGRVGWLR